ncbi:MAG: hypothetical protein ACOWWM_19730 [Desulfobacterales bacterium]
MIASPCKNCVNVGRPKEECAKTCPLIMGIQKIAAEAGCNIFQAIDYSDDARFSVARSLTSPQTSRTYS